MCLVYAEIVQLVERQVEALRCGGSSPPLGTNPDLVYAGGIRDANRRNGVSDGLERCVLQISSPHIKTLNWRTTTLPLFHCCCS